MYQQVVDRPGIDPTFKAAARKEIEAMSGRKVFLELRVKVEKDWRDDDNALRRLGYKIDKKKK